VLYILLDNASKYAPAGTTIRVSAGPDGERFVCISVADEGPGIAPGLRERVFEKFFRVPGRQPSDPRRGGIGLGLPIARRLVEAQAGHIAIAPNGTAVGTTVQMTLPIAADGRALATGAAARTTEK
jgi:signal transduction histidine kinase